MIFTCKCIQILQINVSITDAKNPTVQLVDKSILSKSKITKGKYTIFEINLKQENKLQLEIISLSRIVLPTYLILTNRSSSLHTHDYENCYLHFEIRKEGILIKNRPFHLAKIKACQFCKFSNYTKN